MIFNLDHAKLSSVSIWDDKFLCALAGNARAQGCSDDVFCITLMEMRVTYIPAF